MLQFGTVHTMIILYKTRISGEIWWPRAVIKYNIKMYNIRMTYSFGVVTLSPGAPNATDRGSREAPTRETAPLVHIYICHTRAY